jgi:signal transduction histidine kinase
MRRYASPWRFAELSIRDKLLALVLLPLAVVLPLLGAVLIAWGNVAVDRLLITKVRADLAVATVYFERVLGEVQASADALAESSALQRVLAEASPAAQVALLRRVKARERLDFVNLRAPDGTLRVTDFGVREGPEAADGTVTFHPREDATVELLSPEAFAPLAPALQARVSVPLVETRNAAPDPRRQEDRAMVVLAQAPVRAADGRLLGHVQAGLLLNRNLPLIDHINEIVYPAGSLPYGSRGTATLFLGDVRVSTNVRLFAGELQDRAVGTRVSQAVRDAVLQGGRTWLDRAFVVSDWYVSGYQPLVDGSGRRVGMLYVGFLEQPFTWVKYGVLASIALMFLAVMTGAAWVCLRWARGIFGPIEQMSHTMQRVEAGALAARVGPLKSRDEIGRLAGHLDHLLDTIDDKTAALQRSNAVLDARVAERTRALEAAQEQLMQAEKLATVGQLTASIAHEVNNPIAVIQGNLDLLRTLLPPDATHKVRTELALVDEQIERMRLIVTQLLQFARPGEFAGYVEPVDTTQAMEDCLVLVGHLLARTRIEIRRDLTAARRPAINRNELQQVLVNLLVNAVQAMPEGGVLTLAGRDAADGGVEITVSDTGGGLSDDLLAELFKPFVTRKKGGTGLGLWISRSIVQRYGGDIRAVNRSDGIAGAVFTVALHLEAPDERSR